MHFYDLWKKYKGTKRLKNGKKANFKVNLKKLFCQFRIIWNFWNSPVFPFLLLKTLLHIKLRALKWKEKEPKNPPPRGIQMQKNLLVKKGTRKLEGQRVQNVTGETYIRATRKLWIFSILFCFYLQLYWQWKGWHHPWL